MSGRTIKKRFQEGDRHVIGSGKRQQNRQELQHESRRGVGGKERKGGGRNHRAEFKKGLEVGKSIHSGQGAGNK